VDLEILVENVLNAVTAGITIGCSIYGLMCIGLGLIFGIMRIVNFAQGELLMLGMFASFYLVSEGRILAFLGPYWEPFIEMLHKIDLKDGPAKFFPEGRVKFEENGRRVGAELCIVQWQKGRPTAVHPESIAASKAIWPKS
jgi:hypothetical protein